MQPVASSPQLAASPPAADPGGPFALVRTFVLLLVLPVAIFAALVGYSHFARTTASPSTPGKPGELVWSDGAVIFSNKAQLVAWLRLHGSTLHAFLKQHPAAARLLESRPQHRTVPAASHTKAKPSTTAAVTPPPPAPAPTARTAAPAVASTGPDATVYWIAGALGVLLAAFALVPAPLVRRIGLRPGRERDLRFSAAAAAVALLVGVAFGTTVG
jgi:hypothetical protein